jgi:hypothetical protein
MPVTKLIGTEMLTLIKLPKTDVNWAQTSTKLDAATQMDAIQAAAAMRESPGSREVLAVS